MVYMFVRWRGNCPGAVVTEYCMLLSRGCHAIHMYKVFTRLKNRNDELKILLIEIKILHNYSFCMNRLKADITENSFSGGKIIINVILRFELSFTT